MDTSNVIDPVLSGNRKIDWVRTCMPVLSLIEKDFIKNQPFKGLKVALSIHMEAKTANLAYILKLGGAEVYATGCNPLSTQDDVAAALAERGVHVYAKYGVNAEEYEQGLIQALSCKPDIVLDDGGDFTALLHSKCRDLGINVRGITEETTTGIHRLKAREADGTLSYPAVDVNDAQCKHLFDNRYGTGQSVLDAIMYTTNRQLSGKHVVVAGYGWCGRGVAMRAKGLGAIVTVTEIDPVKAIEAANDGFIVKKMDDAASYGDVFITVTGCEKVITRQHFEKMKDGAMFCNAGHFDVEVDKIALKELSVRQFTARQDIESFVMEDGRVLNLLADGRLVNLAAGNGHAAEIMDMSFSLQALTLEYLANQGKELQKKVYEVPEEIDRKVAYLKADAMGIGIDTLTSEQAAYLGSY